MSPGTGKLMKRVGIRRGIESDDPRSHRQSDDYSINQRNRSRNPLPFRELMISGESGSTSSVENITQTQTSYFVHGSISVLGRKRVMEDAVKVVPGLLGVGNNSTTYDFFAVYHGHGGSAVANACHHRMHSLLVNEVRNDERSTSEGYRLDWHRVMISCFAKMDQEISGVDGDSDPCSPHNIQNVNPSRTMSTGATAVLVLVSRKEIVVASNGGSRSVLCVDGMVVPLPCDHKHDRPDEQEGIEAAGGRVINRNGCRFFGVLATSRSIAGDKWLKPYVICEPEVSIHRRTEADEFIIIASDGLWDVISNDCACEVVKRNLQGHLTKQCPDCFNASCACADQAAALLAELALARGSKDNISVVVVLLQSLA